MRLTLFKYISHEIWSLFVVSLLVFTFIALAASMMSITDLLVNQGFSLSQVIKIIFCMLPQVILFSLPVACLMSVMLAFVRLASDNEIIALNASGVSLYQLLPPVIIFSLVCCVSAGFLAIYGVPWGNRSLKDYELGIIKSKTNLTVKERVFYEPIDKLVFYVSSYSTREKEMRDVLVVDRRDEKTINTIVAEKGMIITGRIPNTIDIRFVNAAIFVDDKDNITSRKTVKLPEFVMSIDLGDIASKIAAREKKPNELYIRELISGLKEKNVKPSQKTEMEILLYGMFSMPLAIFVLGIIGASLGSHVKARGRTAGIMISLFVFIIYYISLMGSQYLCEMGLVAPFIGVWVPVLLLLAISTFLLTEVKRYGVFRFFY